MTAERNEGRGAPQRAARGEGALIGADEFAVPPTILCPFCQGEETELHSAFGGQLSTSTYWCRECKTAFEWFKWSP